MTQAMVDISMMEEPDRGQTSQLLKTAHKRAKHGSESSNSGEEDERRLKKNCKLPAKQHNFSAGATNKVQSEANVATNVEKDQRQITVKGRVIIVQPIGEEDIINKFIGKTILVNNLLEKS